MRKFAKKALTGTLSFAMVLGMATAVNPETASAKKVTVKKVTVKASSGSTAYVAKGKTVKLTATVKVTPNKKANKKVTFKSANKKIATVNAKGQVKGIKPGSTKITVTSKKNSKKKASIKVIVQKTAVKKVTISAKKATIGIGEKKTLKASVSPKGASKQIAWSSSKTKVATVSNKGVVTGKKKGTAVITAAAADGSGKKATCKVTVKNSVNMSGMDVQNAQTVTFSLDKAQALTMDKVIVKTKVYANGEYRNQLVLDNISTTDNKNYTVVVNSDTRISVNNFVQVSVPTLSGKVKSMEKEYTEQNCAFTDEEVSRWTVGTYSKKSFSFGEGMGYSSYTITGLPAGLTSEVKGDYVYVKGTPTAPGTTTATLSATDEKGNTLTKAIYFVIGSKDVIAGAGLPDYALVANTDVNNVRAYAYFTGGSGYYKYMIINDGGTGATISEYDDDEYSYSYVCLSARVAAPGDYNIIVRATDDAGRTCDVAVPVHVAQGISVAGLVKDASGNPIPNAHISFTNKNRADRFSQYSYAYTDKDGAYGGTLSSGTYDIAASYHDDSEYSDNAKAYNYLYKQDLTTTKSGFDISLPLYKVTLVSTDPFYPLISANGYSNYTWYSNHEKLGSGNTLYLKNGTYAIESDEEAESGSSLTNGDWFNGMTVTSMNYKMVGNVAVNNAAAQTSVSKSVVPSETKTYPAAKDTTYPAYVDSYYDLKDAGNYCAYYFVPTVTGKYSISNTDVSFYSMDGTKVTPTTEEWNDETIYELTADTKYIVGTGSYNSYDRFRITKIETPDN